MMKTTLKFHGGLHFSGETVSGHHLQWDSGPEGAVTKGPTPMEAMLQAGAVCSAMDLVSILKKRRKEIANFEIDVEASRAADHPKIFKDYHITFRVGGDGIAQEEVEKAVKLSQERYCSVINMFKPDVRVFCKVEVLPSRP